MPRKQRITIPNIAYHITQRGNYRQEVFKKEEDYKHYCRWVNEYSEKYELEIMAYCLMTNHVHIIGIPLSEYSIARTFNLLNMRYAQYVNKGEKIKGHLWQGRYYSCALDEQHLYRAIRYVERNPVRAKMVKEAWEYSWSSARYHMGKEERAAIELSQRFDTVKREEWENYLKEEDLEMCQEIRIKTHKGLVVGSEGFTNRLENILGRSLVCRNPGRPKLSGKGS